MEKILLWSILALVLFLIIFAIYSLQQIKNERKKQMEKFQVLFQNNSFGSSPKIYVR